MNPRLSDAVSRAKKIGFPKSSIDSAIARGQGVSPSGLALENVTIEAMIPPQVAFIIECQTDSKLRTLSDMRLAVKNSGGAVTPTNHYFERKGKIVFEKPDNFNESDVFDRAVEAGALDVETEEDGTVLVYTEASQTIAIASALASSMGFNVRSSDIIWDPKEDTMVDASSHEAIEDLMSKSTSL